MRRLHCNYTGMLALVGATLVADCTALEFKAANLPTHFSQVLRLTNLSYGSDPRQRLDVYMPTESGPHPVVIFWYGGSWTSGRKADYRFVGAALADRGIVAVLPDYRLYPQVRFPAFVEDGAQAVRWVEVHAQEFGGDARRVVLMGHSAGAFIAALLAYEPRYLADAGVDRGALRAVIGLSGPYALVPDDDSLSTIFSRPFTPRDWQPVQHVDRLAPPTLLLDGLDDRRVNPIQTRNLHDALLAHSVPVEMELYAGVSHTDTIAGFAKWGRHRSPSLDRVARYIGTITAPPRSPAN